MYSHVQITSWPKWTMSFKPDSLQCSVELCRDFLVRLFVGLSCILISVKLNRPFFYSYFYKVIFHINIFGMQMEHGFLNHIQSTLLATSQPGLPIVISRSLASLVNQIASIEVSVAEIYSTSIFCKLEHQEIAMWQL